MRFAAGPYGSACKEKKKKENEEKEEKKESGDGSRALQMKPWTIE